MAKEYPTFNSYKGLQKPLVFKMFKGPYIYKALGILIAALLACIICGIVGNLVIGLLLLLAIGLGGLLLLLKKQKKDGLYKKDKSEGLYIVNYHKLSKFER